MKKKTFLTSIAVLAAAMALEAGAALPQSLTDQSTIKIGRSLTAEEITRAQIPFVLERSVLTDNAHAKHSYHSSHGSHSSHSSHSSHHSSRY